MGTIVNVPEYTRANGAKKLSVNDSCRKEVLKRYIMGESCPEIAKSFGISTSTAWRIVKESDAVRPHSEAMALRMAVYPNIADHRGVSGVFHSRKGNCWIPTGSRYEYIRMAQLEDDDTVKVFYRCKDRIPYLHNNKIHYYIPDIEIFKFSGLTYIEEVKPYYLSTDKIVMIKLNAAMIYYRDIGKKIVLVTENEIGIDFIKNFDWSGIAALSHEDRKALGISREKVRQRLSKRKKYQELSEEDRIVACNICKNRYHKKKAAMTKDEMVARLAGWIVQGS